MTSSRRLFSDSLICLSRYSLFPISVCTWGEQVEEEKEEEEEEEERGENEES